MKALHFYIVVIFSVSFVILNSDAFADNTTNNVEIINIQTHPSMIKLGDVFTVNATLVNNSPNPISIVSSPCEVPFTVKFDNHITIDVKKGIGCPLMNIVQTINSGDKTTGTSPSSQSFTYRTTQIGTTNATITFSYLVRNQTDHNPSTIAKTISKSFSFVIYGNNKTVNETDSSIPRIPEFPFAIPVLLISITSLIVFYRMRFRK